MPRDHTKSVGHPRRGAVRQYVLGGAAIVAMMSTLLFLQPAVSQATTVTSHFVVTGTSSNTSGDSVFLNNGATNSQPNDLLFVTQNWDPNGVCGCVYQTATVGVWYDSNTLDKWAVFREDGGAMPLGASFNVLVVPAASSSVFVQTSTSSNTSDDSTFIDSSLTNDQPKATLQVTQNFNPDGVGGAYNTHAVGVWYDNTNGEWAIFNEDQTPMATGLSFNVMVGATPSNGGKTQVQKASLKNISGDGTIISNSQTTGNPNTVIFQTPVWNPGGKGGTYDNDVPGVYYTGSEALVLNENGTTMAKKTAFDLLIFSS
jgi:hypothetical protein